MSTINGNATMAGKALTDPMRETLSVFTGIEPRTTREVADALGLHRRTAYARLERLADDRRLRTKKVGANARVWWRPNRPAGAVADAHDLRADDLLDHVFDDVAAGMVLVDGSRRIVWMNAVFASYFDVDRARLIGRDQRTVIEEAVAPMTAEPENLFDDVEAMARDAEGRDAGVECRVRGDGQSRWIECRRHPIETGPFAGGYIEIYEDVTERRAAQRVSRDRSEEFHSLVDAVEEYAIFTLDPDGYVRSWNPGACRIKGYDADEILGEHFSTFYPEDARAAGVPARNLEIAAAEGSLEDTGKRVRADGSTFWANVTISAIRNDVGELTGFAKVTRDMTRQRNYERRLEYQAKRLERQRDELERELEDIFRRIEDAFLTIDEDWRITYVNDRVEELVEIPAGELIGSTVWESFPEIADGHPRDGAERAMATGDPFEFEHYSGALEAWLEVRCFPTEASMSVYFRDITDRKEREQALLRTNAQLEAAAQAGKIGTWDWNLQQDEFFAGAWFDELFDMEPEEMRAGAAREQFLEPIVAADRERVERAIDEAIATGGDFEAEYRVRDANGDRRWVVARGTVECDAAGEPLEFPGAVVDITARKRSEMALAQRSEQQRAVADLGQLALADTSLDRLMAMACEWISEVLDHEYAQILQADDGRTLRMREGVGWPAAVIDAGTVDAGEPNTLARAVMEEGAITVADIAEDDRFDPPATFLEHGIRSGVSTVIGPVESPWGVLGTYDTKPAAIPREDEIFVQSMANVLANAIDRTEREDRLAARRDELATLNHLNTVVTDVAGAVIEESTRQQIEQIVCDALAGSDAYTSAWVAEADPHANVLRERASAQTDGYADDVTVPLDTDEDTPRPPGVAAIQEQDTQVVRNVATDPRVAPFRPITDDYEFSALASIPIVHDGTVYGVLGVYTDRENAFDAAEVDVIGKLGRIVGHAIASTERQRALMSDELVELEFRIREPFEAHLEAPIGGPIELDHAVPVGDERFVVYGTTPADSIGALETLVEEIETWDSISLRADGDPARFELQVVESPILSLVASVGGYIRSARFEAGRLELTVHLAPSADVRQLIGTIEEIYPGAEMVRRRQISRPGESSRYSQRAIVGDLTDRQREVLDVALHSGYFEWPRDATGEEVAALMGIAPATFSQHLRRAQRQVFDRLLPRRA